MVIKNLVRIDDLKVILRKIFSGDFFWRINNIFLTEEERVRRRWKFSRKNEFRHWYTINEFEKQKNKHITGHRNISYYIEIANLFKKKSATLLSVGCGDGEREFNLSRYNKFYIDAIDISENQIQNARIKYPSKYINFFCANFFKLTKSYDAVFFGHSLHHFTNIDSVIKKAMSLVKKDGYLVVDEYVGPNQFQWTDTQKKYANEALEQISSKYRKRIDGTIKKKVDHIGTLMMKLNDPSEAIESEDIDPVLSKYNVIRRVPIGGTLTHLVLQDIAHNFNCSESRKYLMNLINFERNLIESNIISSDFNFYIIQK